MRQKRTGGLIGQALTMLFWACAALLVGVWKLFEAYPWATTLGAFFLIWLGVATRREMKRQKAAAMDARLRDEHVPSMSPGEYEQFAARLLERASWKVLHTGRTGDQGCDVLAELRGFKAVVQVKLFRNRVGNGAVQEVVAARRHYDAHVMAVVAPAGFTRAAADLAASNGVHLIGHAELARLETAARIP